MTLLIDYLLLINAYYYSSVLVPRIIFEGWMYVQYLYLATHPNLAPSIGRQLAEFAKVGYILIWSMIMSYKLKSILIEK